MINLTKNSPKILIIPLLELFELSSDGERLYEGELLSEKYLRQTIPEFPCLLCSDGSPWAEGNKYLLDSISQRLSFSLPTLKSIAYDLLRFLKYLDRECIDFKAVPKRQPAYPTHRFNYELNMMVESCKLSSATAKRCIGRIFEFYDWMAAEGIVPNALSTSHRKVKSIGARYRYSKSNRSLAERSSLIALSIDDQKNLIEFLGNTTNIEMRLIFATAILTGMRIQSVLTLKTHVFNALDSHCDDYCTILIGTGTGIDSKYGVNNAIYIPRKLMIQLRIYSESDRAKKRRIKNALGCYENYVFLSNRGQPYYVTQEDRIRLGNTCFTEGAAIRKYIKNTIVPNIGLKFTFHCLRATFAMNLVDSQLALVQSGKINLNQARNYVRERLGHSSSEVTDEYLNVRMLVAHTKDLQNSYESQLLDAI